MTRKIFSLLMICAGALAILLFASFIATPVAAQGTPPPEECQCKQCHEQQYYLHDTGKWYCMCEAPMTCVHCHGGNGQDTNIDLAHKDMLANPFTNNAAVCKECHKEESQARVDEFVKRAGGNMPVAVEEQPAYYTAGLQPFPETAPRVLGFWEWFSVTLMGSVLVWLFIAWRR